MSKFIDQKDFEHVSIVEFLAKLGHSPVKKSGREHFYHSILRETKQDTPSLTVWDEGGKWIDRGGPNSTGIQGGSIVQLGLAYWPQLSFVEVLNKIMETCDIQVSTIPAYNSVLSSVEQEQREFFYELVKTKPIGSNFVLTKFLEARGILDVAEGHLHEVYYKKRLDNENKSVFYAIGWKNDLGNWEFSSAKGFKSSIGAKGISVIPGNPEHSVLFEGYIDYLSWFKVNRPDPAPTAIVLNSIVQLGKAIERVKDIPIVDVYFDNDDPGRNCTQRLIEAVPHAKDRSGIYGAYKDYNDLLRAALNGEELQHQRASHRR